MISEELWEPSAVASINERSFCISTDGGGMGSWNFFNATHPEIFLPPDADEAVLGASMRTALSRSQPMSRAEADKVRMMAAGGFKRKVKELLKYGRYKTMSSLYKEMKYCDLCKKNQQLHLKAGYLEQSETGARDLQEGHNQIQRLSIPWSSSDREFGEALRRVWARLVDKHASIPDWARVASIELNEKLLVVSTWTGRFYYFLDAEAPITIFPADVDDSTLGRCVREAAQRSRQVRLEEYDRLKALKPVAHKEKLQRLLKYGKYKTQKALFQNMKCCEVLIFGECLALKLFNADGSAQRSLEPYGECHLEIEQIPLCSSDDEVGATFRALCARFDEALSTPAQAPQVGQSPSLSLYGPLDPAPAQTLGAVTKAPPVEQTQYYPYAAVYCNDEKCFILTFSSASYLVRDIKSLNKVLHTEGSTETLGEGVRKALQQRGPWWEKPEFDRLNADYPEAYQDCMKTMRILGGFHTLQEMCFKMRCCTFYKVGEQLQIDYCHHSQSERGRLLKGQQAGGQFMIPWESSNLKLGEAVRLAWSRLD